MQQHCFMCGIALVSHNSSDEHILLNALGGHLHSPSLLCKTCNSTLGRESDNELARELNYAASYLNIPRQRGENQIIITSEEETYDLLPGGKPQLKKPIVKTQISETGGKVEIVARSKEEAQKIIKDLAKKHSAIDINEALQHMTVREEYLGKKIGFKTSFHAARIYPSIIKSAVEYYLLCGGSKEYISHLIPYIKGELDGGECCKYFYPAEPWFASEADEILHILYVRGCTQNRMLYGFVSYFGIIQCLVLLNDHYDGPDVDQGYAYNVMTRAKKAISPKYQLDRAEVLKRIALPYDKHIEPMLLYGNEFLRKAEKYKIHEHWELMLRKAWDKTIGQYPEGTVVTNKMVHEFTDEFSVLAGPWLAAHLKHEDS